VRLLPQPFRLARTGVAAGVSALAAINATISAGAWLAYGVSAGLPVVWGVSILALVPGIWTAILLRREVRPGDGLGAAALTAALVVAAVAHALGVALAASVLVTAGPQVWRAVRANDLTGIAPTTWWVAVLDALSWGAYGLVIGDLALEGYCVVLLSSAVIVLARLRWVGAGRSSAAAVGERSAIGATDEGAPPT
jgi:uncharacterized protein with PQ loop repeat